MSSCRSSIVSILNNDDNPSFAVRSAPRLSRGHPSLSFYSQQREQLPVPVSEPQYARPVSSEPPVASPRVSRHPFESVTKAAPPTTPGSSDGSAYDYFSSQPSSVYYQYALQDPRQDTHRYLALGAAPVPMPPETQAGTAPEGSPSHGSTRGTGRKNKYPCPYAASHGCLATFTTSGHAARHGKKHTGEKSVHCPICNKAFTRKDNMKQHIRTHRTHSDDMRSVSEPETEARWTAPPTDAS